MSARGFFSYPKLISQESGFYSTPHRATNQVGQILLENNWSNLSKYTNAGTGISVSNNQLNFTGGVATFNDYLLLSDAANPYHHTATEEWRVRVKVIAPTINGASYGIGIGVRGTNTFTVMNAIARWCWDTTAPCTVALYPANSTSGQLTVGASPVLPTAGRTYWLELVRAKNVYTFTATDTSGNTITTATFTMNLGAGATNQGNNTGQFVLENFGGTNVKILEWNISSTAPVGIEWAVMGDSNTYGMFSGSNTARYFENAMSARNKTFRVFAGIGDRTVDAILRVDEVIAARPKKCLINLIRNDIAGAVATATWQANYLAIVKALEDAGIVVYAATPIAGSTDVSLGVAFVKMLGRYTLEFFEITRSPGTTAMKASVNGGDNIHLNAFGNGLLSAETQRFI